MGPYVPICTNEKVHVLLCETPESKSKIGGACNKGSCTESLITFYVKGGEMDA